MNIHITLELLQKYDRVLIPKDATITYDKELEDYGIRASISFRDSKFKYNGIAIDCYLHLHSSHKVNIYTIAHDGVKIYGHKTTYTPPDRASLRKTIRGMRCSG